LRNLLSWARVCRTGWWCSAARGNLLSWTRVWGTDRWLRAAWRNLLSWTRISGTGWCCRAARRNLLSWARVGWTHNRVFRGRSYYGWCSGRTRATRWNVLTWSWVWGACTRGIVSCWIRSEGDIRRQVSITSLLRVTDSCTPDHQHELCYRQPHPPSCFVYDS